MSKVFSAHAVSVDGYISGLGSIGHDGVEEVGSATALYVSTSPRPPTKEAP